MMNRALVERLTLLLVSASCGFAVGLGVPLDAAHRQLWLALSTPGYFLFYPFVSPGVSVWMVPVGNGVAYALGMALLMWALSLLTRRFRTGPSRLTA